MTDPAGHPRPWDAQTPPVGPGEEVARTPPPQGPDAAAANDAAQAGNPAAPPPDAPDAPADPLAGLLDGLPPPDPEAAKFRNLDLSNGHDRGALNRATSGHLSKHRRYRQIDDDVREQMVKAGKAALSIAISKRDARAIASCIRTLGLLDKMNQDDEHLEAKLQANEAWHRDRMTIGERVNVSAVRETRLESVKPDAELIKAWSDYAARVGLENPAGNQAKPEIPTDPNRASRSSQQSSGQSNTQS